MKVKTKTVVILGPHLDLDDDKRSIADKAFRPKTLLEIIKDAEYNENKARNSPVEEFVPDDQEHYDNFKIPDLESGFIKK